MCMLVDVQEMHFWIFLNRHLINVHVDCVPHVGNLCLNLHYNIFSQASRILRQHTFLYIYVIILLSKACLVLSITIFISVFFLA